MKLRLSLLFGVVLIALLAGACSKEPAAKPATNTLYTCSMHPQVILDHPGNCPICGMKLEPVHQTPEGTRLSDDSKRTDVISVDPVTIQQMGVRTAQVTKGPLQRVIRTVGVV